MNRLSHLHITHPFYDILPTLPAHSNARTLQNGTHTPAHIHKHILEHTNTHHFFYAATWEFGSSTRIPASHPGNFNFQNRVGCTKSMRLNGIDSSEANSVV